MIRPRIVARCGDGQNAPESTLLAFVLAIEKGADAIELDVHPTRDGELVVHHDFYLGRTNNGKGYIGDLTRAELRELDAGSWFAARSSGEKIPTLRQVLELGKGKTRFEIDMKGSSLDFLERLLDQVARFAISEDVELTSAHIPLLFQVKAVNPALRTGMFFRRIPEWMTRALSQRHILDCMSISNCQVAHLDSSVLDGEFVSRLQENGFLVHGSNLNREEDIAHGIASGIDQLSTDKLDLALSVVNTQI
jgi:glycerophosphoryl diester phosphodiesterase